MSLLVWLDAYYLSPYFTAATCFIFAAWLLKRFLPPQLSPPEPSYLVDEAKIKTDPGKALAQQVKFMLRLKRRMKSFREKKALGQLRELQRDDL